MYIRGDNMLQQFVDAAGEWQNLRHGACTPRARAIHLSYPDCRQRNLALNEPVKKRARGFVAVLKDKALKRMSLFSSGYEPVLKVFNVLNVADFFCAKIAHHDCVDIC
jgi:hypothetical protein